MSATRKRQLTKAAAEADCYVAWAQKDRATSQLIAVQKKIELLTLKEAERAEADMLAHPDTNRIYTFYGGVDQARVEAAMETMGMWSRRDPGQPMQLILNSPGGECVDGLAFYDFLIDLRKTSGHHLTTLVRGEASSMGGIILQAADWRIMGDKSTLMLHEIHEEQVGFLSTLEDKTTFMRRYNDRMDLVFSERGTMTAEEIREKLRHFDWFLFAEEALKLGFIDEVR